MMRGPLRACTCIHNQLDLASDGAVGNRRRQFGSRQGVIGGWHQQGSDYKGHRTAQIGEERGHGCCSGSLVRAEPRGGQEGAGAHYGGTGETVEQLTSVDQPVAEKKRRKISLSSWNKQEKSRTIQECPSFGNGDDRWNPTILSFNCPIPD